MSSTVFSNSYVSFLRLPDYANASTMTNIQSGTDIYTATRDCMIFLNFAGTSRVYRDIMVNGKTVASPTLVATSPTMVTPLPLMLSSGDVVTTNVAFSSTSSCFFWVVPMIGNAVVDDPAGVLVPTIVTNEDGTAYKFPNGMMICTKIWTGTITINTSWQSMYEGSVNLGNWAVGFTNTPCVSITHTGATGAMLESVTNASSTAIGTAYFARPNSISNQAFVVNCIALGTWS